VANQIDLFGDEPALPEGLRYRADLLDDTAEARLIERLGTLPFAPFQFHGFEGKRRTVSFGWQYRFDGSGLAEAEPMPAWLLPVRDQAAAFAGLEPAALAHALLIEYAPGAGIGWHRDRPDFGEVVGISLASAAPLRFRRKADAKWQRFTLAAARRSAYHLAGPARSEWEHSIAALETLRYSITFRTLRRPAGSAPSSAR
jgi:DNA oxidative demethylase